MSTKNEILFSVRLENGIVITGSSLDQVKDFMLDLQFASDYYADNDESCKELGSDLRMLACYLRRAWLFIHKVD